MVAFARKKRVSVAPEEGGEAPPPVSVPLLSDGDRSFVVQLCLLTNTALPHGVWPFLKRPDVTKLQELTFRKHHQHIGWPEEFLDFGVENMSRLTGLRTIEVEGRGTMELCIEALLLEDRGVEGRLPAAIGNLKHLLEINLQNNRFVGGIPQEIGGCSLLSVINMSYNHLSGELPSSIGDLKNLAILRVYENRLTGFLPITLGQAPLTEVALGRNSLRGYTEEELRCTVKADCDVLTRRVVGAAAAARAGVRVAVLAATSVAALQMRLAALVAALVGSCAATSAGVFAQQAEQAAFGAEMREQAAHEAAIMLRMAELRAQPLALEALVEPIIWLIAEFESMVWLTAPPPTLEKKSRKSRTTCLLKQIEAEAWLSEVRTSIDIQLKCAAEVADQKRQEAADKAEKKAAKARKAAKKKEKAAAAERKAAEEQDALRVAHLARQQGMRMQVAGGEG
jgi:hypothetical protein